MVAVEPGADERLELLTAVLDPVPALTPALARPHALGGRRDGERLGGGRVPRAPAGSARGRAADAASAAARLPAGLGRASSPGRPARSGSSAGSRRRSPRAGAPSSSRRRSSWLGRGPLRLEARLHERAALVTSAATPRARWAAWWACRTGTARLAVGTRTAAWLPLAPLGLAVVVDEEDPAHKSPDAPRWHARDLVQERVRRDGGASLLASPAPSLESWVAARAGALARDPGPRGAWPTVERVALGADEAATASLSPGLRDAARAAIARGRSVLLVLNRLGYARTLACAECGAVRRCGRCRLALLYHRETRTLACRLCGRRVPAASLCGRCRGRRLQLLGWGTERLEAEARQAFPEAQVVRYDSTVAPDAAAAARTAFQSGAARVLVGTTMALRLAEETPVAVAALVLADATLNLPDFRAGERTFQLAWRLGETVEAGGSLWLQSLLPDHPALLAVAEGEPDRFYEAEWAERRELGYPPARRMARLLAEGRDGEALARDLAERGQGAGATVLGPAPLAGGRVQVVLLGGPDLPATVAAVLEPLRGRRRLRGARLTVDIDPVELP